MQRLVFSIDVTRFQGNILFTEAPIQMTQPFISKVQWWRYLNFEKLVWNISDSASTNICRVLSSSRAGGFQFSNKPPDGVHNVLRLLIAPERATKQQYLLDRDTRLIFPRVFSFRAIHESVLTANKNKS